MHASRRRRARGSVQLRQRPGPLVQLRQRAGRLVQLRQRAHAFRLALHSLIWPVLRPCLGRVLSRRRGRAELRWGRRCRWVLRWGRRCRWVLRWGRRCRWVLRWVLRWGRRCRWVLPWLRRCRWALRSRRWRALPARSSRLVRRRLERPYLVRQSCPVQRADGALKLTLMRVGPAASNDASPGQTRELAVELSQQRQ